MNIWVYVQESKGAPTTASLELLTKARSLGGTVSAFVAGDGATIAAAVGEYGATKLYATGPLGGKLPGAAVASAIKAVIDGGDSPDLSCPSAAMRCGIGLVAGDRTAESLAMSLSVRENLFLNPAANGRRARDWQRPAVELRQARVLCGRFGVRPSDPARPAETLSGGNQQKVVIARWLEIAERLLILEEPTAGVDVGAKAEIYALLNAALERGLAILVIATDFEEVANICHRALVFSRGEVVDELGPEQLSIGAILHAASAGAHAAAAPA